MIHGPLRQGDGLAQMRKLIFVLAITTIVMPAFAEPIDPVDIRVIDGDTIRVHHKQPNVRLVGFNAPETRNAGCNAEAELGARATRRLRDLVKLGNLDFSYVRCSCPEATQGTFACNYARDCGTLRSNGRDVGAILIEEGLAVPFVCGPTHCPQTPRPWCHE
jgi:endonuclease YncB( thermonuclease family)